MAERRMFAKTIIDSDAFLTMPLSTQALYFHLSMRGDDEGFVNKPKSIMRTIGSNEDDLKLLIAKKFIIPFDSGVVVIKHWKIHNYIRGDRIKETVYQEEKSMLTEKENGSYSLSVNNDEQQQLKAADIRKLAYQNSSLPYSFEYKIRNCFNGKKCPICNCTMGVGEFGHKLCIPTIQHNVPISKGGEHELYNISVICKSCNASLQNDETGELNNLEVIKAWSDICQSNDSQVSAQVRLGKVRLGKDSIGKVIDIIPYQEIIDYLNKKATTSFKSTSTKTKSLIDARYNEGFTIEDFKKVIDNKVQEWNREPLPGKEDMRQYLRPITLFSNKFESYLNQKPVIYIHPNKAVNKGNFEQRQYDDSYYDSLYDNTRKET